MRYPSWIVLGKTKSGEYLGYIENSFSMGNSKVRVRVERYYELSTRYTKRTKQEIHNIMKRSADRLNKSRFCDAEWRVYRVGTKTCPVKIDWRETVEMRKTRKWDKFKGRNLPFTVK